MSGEKHQEGSHKNIRGELLQVDEQIMLREDTGDQTQVQLVTSRENVWRRTDFPLFYELKAFNENLAALSSRKRSCL